MTKNGEHIWIRLPSFQFSIDRESPLYSLIAQCKTCKPCTLLCGPVLHKPQNWIGKNNDQTKELEGGREEASRDREGDEGWTLSRPFMAREDGNGSEQFFM